MLKSSVTIAITLALLTTVTGFQAVHAAQFKKLLEIGQSIPGNKQPLIFIGDTTLGRDGQVVTVLSTDSSSGQGSFQGVYSISKGGNLRLVEAGGSKADVSVSKFFSKPSLSEGQIAYSIVESSRTPTGFQELVSFRFGTTGDMKTILPPRPATTGFETPDVVLTNGIVHILERKPSFEFGVKDRYTLSQVNTTQNNAVTVIGQVFDPLSYVKIRAGADSLVVQQKERTSAVLKLLERPLSQGAFSPIVPIGKNPGSCGFAVSFDSVVSCSEKDVRIGQADYSLSVRFGKAGVFQPIAIPNLSKIVLIDSPSISQDKVVFRTFERDSAGADIVRIYLSFNAKTPQVLLKTGSKLDGKTVSSVSLSNDDRSIAVNSVVVGVSFTDRSQALYRVDF